MQWLSVRTQRMRCRFESCVIHDHDTMATVSHLIKTVSLEKLGALPIVSSQLGIEYALQIE